jgi:O-methyltransferase
MSTSRKIVWRKSAGAVIYEPAIPALVDAAARGDAPLVAALLGHAATRPYVTKAVWSAVLSGRTDVLSVIWRKTSAAVLHDRQHLALRMAARAGDVAMFRLLLSSGSLVGARNRQAARLAQVHGHIEIVAICRELGAPPFELADMIAAARRDDTRRLARTLGDPTLAPHVTRAVFAAVAANSIHAVRLAKSLFGAAVLHDRRHLALRIAARAGFTELVGVMLESGSPVDAHGDQAVRLARLHGHRRIAALLENRGADGHPVATPADLIKAARANDTAALDVYLDDPALVGHASRAVIAAAQSGSADVVDVIRSRLPPSVLHDRDHLALRCAVRCGDARILAAILDSGGDFAARGGQAVRIALSRNNEAAIDAAAARGLPTLASAETAIAMQGIGRRVSGPIILVPMRGCDDGAVEKSLMRLMSAAHWLKLTPAERGRAPDLLAPPPAWQREAVGKALARLEPARQSEPLLVAGNYTARIRDLMPPSRLFLGFVGDPVARVVRLCRMLTAAGDQRLMGGIERLFDSSELPPWAQYAFCDHQVRALSGNAMLAPDHIETDRRLEDVGAEDADAVIAEAAESWVLLGVAERPQESLLALWRQLGLPLVGLVNRHRPDKRKPKMISTDVLARIGDLNQQDARLAAAANEQLDALISEDAEGFKRDEALLKWLGRERDRGIGYGKLMKAELAARGQPEPRLSYRQRSASTTVTAGSDYLDLIEDVLINRIYRDPGISAWSRGRHHLQEREIGSDWPAVAHSMIGKRRMRNLRELCELALRDGVPGDFAETGVWRGGAAILMRAVLKAHRDDTRTVWVADSFAGVPPPNVATYPADAGDVHFQAEALSISQAEVAENFRRYGLLDRQVRFLPGWFKDTLPDAPITRLAVLRLDGDLYESTMDALNSLYRKLSPGGFVIVDDYGAVEGCRLAVEAFRTAHGISEQMRRIDWAGVWWRKS